MEDNDNIIVGFPFMRLFSFMVFDYDNSTIDFYSFSYQIDKDINTSSIDTIKGILYIIDFLYFIISAFKYIFTKKTLLFEKLSKTKLISTIKSN